MSRRTCFQRAFLCPSWTQRGTSSSPEFEVEVEIESDVTENRDQNKIRVGTNDPENGPRLHRDIRQNVDNPVPITQATVHQEMSLTGKENLGAKSK